MSYINSIGGDEPLTLRISAAWQQQARRNRFPGGESNPAILTIAGDPTAVNGIKADAQAVRIRKYVKNGKLVIETPDGIFNLSGVQIK